MFFIKYAIYIWIYEESSGHISLIKVGTWVKSVKILSGKMGTSNQMLGK